jgi:hypothetical protein
MLCSIGRFNRRLRKEASPSKIKRTTFAVLAMLIFAIIEPVTAQENVKRGEQVRERINRAWDEGLKRMWFRQIEAGCKADAKKQYSAIRFNKRRAFVKQCIAKATAAGTSQSMHQPN